MPALDAERAAALAAPRAAAARHEREPLGPLLRARGLGPYRGYAEMLAAVVADDGGWFTTDLFPVALLANPADAFRLFNLSASDAMAVASGVGGAAATIPLWQSALSVVLWPLIALALATSAFRKVTP